MKKIVVCVLSLLILFNMLACALPSEATPAAEVAAAPEQTNVPESDKIVIAVVPKSLNNPVFLEAKAGAEEAAKELGIEILYTASPDSDSAQQVSIVEGLIELQVDGILIACNLAEALQPVIHRAVESGIVVATFDSDAPESKRSFYIGSNNYDFGKVSAEYVNEILPEGGKVGVLTGIIGIANLEERIKGFKEHINANIELLPIQTGEDDIQKSVEVVNQFTAANPEMDAWWFDGGWPFIADPSALTELDKFCKNGGKVVSVDSLYPMLQYLDLGMAEVLIGQNMYACGLDGVRNIVKIINGGTIESEMIWTDMEIVTRDNVAEIRSMKTPW
jgi:ribose transport system substrate-binding protein